MSAPSLFTANQAAVAIAAAAKCVGLHPIDVAVAGFASGISTAKLFEARRAICHALEEVNGRPANVIGAQLKFWKTPAAAFKSFQIEDRKRNKPHALIDELVFALRSNCADDPCGLAPWPPGKPETVEPAGSVSGEAVVDGAEKAETAEVPQEPEPVQEEKPDPARDAAVIADKIARRKRAAMPAKTTHVISESPPDRARVREEKPPMRVEEPARPDPSETADYSKMSPAQIAEHEMCEALLAKADRSTGLYHGAQRLAKDSFGQRRHFGARAGAK